jgi:hypothetical protein
MVKTLLDYGADTKIKDNRGRNVYSYLLSPRNHNQVEILKVLLASDVDSIYEVDPKSKESFVHEVVKKGRTKLLQVLVERNVDLNKKDIDGARFEDCF